MSKDDTNAIRISTALVEVKPVTPAKVFPPSAKQMAAGGDEVAKSLAAVLPSLDDPILGAIVPWFCDKLRSKLSRNDYRRDLATFWLRMRAEGIDPLEVTGDHVRVYKGLLQDSDCRDASISRYLSVIRGVYRQLAIHGLVPWDVARDIQAIAGPSVAKNSTPALTSKQAQEFLDAIPTVTLKGKRDLALLWTYIVTACRVSAIIQTRVGDVNHNGVEYFLQVTEKRKTEGNKILLDAAGAVLEYIEAAEIGDDIEGPLYRPMTRNGLGFERRFMNRKTPLRLVKEYCQAAGINPERLDRRGISPHSLRKTAINDAIRHGAPMTHVQALAGHRDIRTTQLYYERKAEDAELAARRIQIRPSARNDERSETRREIRSLGPGTRTDV